MRPSEYSQCTANSIPTWRSVVSLHSTGARRVLHGGMAWHRRTAARRPMCRQRIVAFHVDKLHAGALLLRVRSCRHWCR